MTIFLTLLTSLLPLYALIALGWGAARWLQADRLTLANLTVYIFGPVVCFGFFAHLELQPAYMVLPFVSFFLMSTTSLVFYAIGKRVYGDNRANLLAMCTGHGNMGYFGLPLVMTVFADAPHWVAVYMFMLLGGSVFEATLSYYFAARGRFNVADSLRKLVCLPMLYAMAAGLMVHALGVVLPPLFETYWAYFKGAYIVAGMMLIGIALGGTLRLVFAPRFLILTFLGKFLFCPLLAAGLIVIDRQFFHLFTMPVYQLVMILALVPPGANIAAFAAQMDLRPEKAASTILLGTLFALFYIPAVLVLLGF